MADHSLRASGYALYGTAVFGAEQYGGHVRSETEVTTPGLTQVHVTTSVSVESSTELTIPTIAQLNVLLATGVFSTTELTIPTVAERNNLTSVSTEATSEVTLVQAMEWPPFEQDTDFTVYVPEANNNVSVGVEDYSNSAYVKYQDNAVYIPAEDIDFTVYVQEENTQIRIAA